MGVRSLRSSISISLVVHLFFLLVCAYLTSKQAALNQKRVTWIEVEPFKLPDLPKKNPAEDLKRKQIVQTDPGQIVDKALPDAFMGAKNQVVDRQTVSKKRETIIAQNPTQNAESKPKKETAVPVPAVKSLGLPVLPHLKELSEAERRGEMKDRWATPGLRAQDFVKGMKESDMTALNTREFVFFGYYQRIRERLDRAWVPILREKLLSMYARGRHLASDTDHSTRVTVIMNPRGEITKVRIDAESGTKELDDAAISAFNSAGPFPNPPKGIVDLNGEVLIPWEFILRS